MYVTYKLIYHSWISFIESECGDMQEVELNEINERFFLASPAFTTRRSAAINIEIQQWYFYKLNRLNNHTNHMFVHNKASDIGGIYNNTDRDR